MNDQFKKIRKIPVFIKSLIFYYFNLPKKNVKDRNKNLFIDIDRNHFSRYLYLLIKFLMLEGYSVILPKKKFLIYDLFSNPEAYLLIKEGIVSFGHYKDQDSILLKKDSIDADYFGKNLDEQPFKEKYYIPMTQHPLMYHLGIWNNTLVNTVRKKSIFMAGNFQKHEYNQIEKNEEFRHIYSRTKLYTFLNEKNLAYSIHTKIQFDFFLECDIDHKIIIIDNSEYKIPVYELRGIINRFDFFFAMPGIVMPFCHNIIEAMSVGTIPFLQKNYADLFIPSLESGYNCIAFNDFGDLNKKIEYALNLEDHIIANIHHNVNKYYEKYLTPKNIVKAIEKNGFKRLILLAEAYSVNLAKSRN